MDALNGERDIKMKIRTISHSHTVGGRRGQVYATLDVVKYTRTEYRMVQSHNSWRIYVRKLLGVYQTGHGLPPWMVSTGHNGQKWSTWVLNGEIHYLP